MKAEGEDAKGCAETPDVSSQKHARNSQKSSRMLHNTTVNCLDVPLGMLLVSYG
jgi:hypothetical protein